MAGLTVKDLLEADVVDITSMEWGGLTLFLRPLSVTAALKAQSIRGGKAAEHLLMNSVVDEKGQFIFKKVEQIKAFLEKPMTKIKPVIDKINEINQLDESKGND